ncbi:MAG: hypothetical protein Q9159_007212, partial [Coniocarpon cinnabarinum]
MQLFFLSFLFLSDSVNAAPQGVSGGPAGLLPEQHQDGGVIAPRSFPTTTFATVPLLSHDADDEAILDNVPSQDVDCGSLKHTSTSSAAAPASVRDSGADVFIESPPPDEHELELRSVEATSTATQVVPLQPRDERARAVLEPRQNNENGNNAEQIPTTTTELPNVGRDADTDADADVDAEVQGFQGYHELAKRDIRHKTTAAPAMPVIVREAISRAKKGPPVDEAGYAAALLAARHPDANGITRRQAN